MAAYRELLCVALDLLHKVTRDRDRLREQHRAFVKSAAACASHAPVIPRGAHDEGPARGRHQAG